MWCLHFQSCWLQRTRAPLLPLRPLYPSSAGAVRARTQPGPEEHLQSHARYPTQRALTSGARTGNSDNTAVGWCTARQEEGQGMTLWMSRLMSRWLLLFSFTVLNIRYLTWLDWLKKVIWLWHLLSGWQFIICLQLNLFSSEGNEFLCHTLKCLAVWH